jgi:hypothetical protein
VGHTRLGGQQQPHRKDGKTKQQHTSLRFHELLHLLPLALNPALHA